MQEQTRCLYPYPVLKSKNCDYRIIGTIDYNSFVSVNHALSLNTNNKFVIKFVSSKYPFYKSAQEGCKIAQSISHLNIVAIIDSFILPNDLNSSPEPLFVTIMKDYQDIDLFFYLQDNGPFAEIEAACIMKQLADSLFHISGNGIVHRQLIPENILIQKNQDSTISVAVTGFTAAGRIDSQYPSLQSCNSVSDDPYAAPELLRDRQSTVQTDVFSLGIVFYQLLTGITPSAYSQLHENGPFGGPIFSHVSEIMIELLQGMIHEDPNQRLSPEQIYKHPALFSVKAYEQSIFSLIRDLLPDDSYDPAT